MRRHSSAKAKTQPLVLLADREPVLAIREYIAMPVVLVLPSEERIGR